jgi:hypothetical protein
MASGLFFAIGAKVGAMDDETATSTIDEITKLVIRYAEGFAGDPDATIEFYALPMIYVGPDAVSVIGSREEAVAFVEGILERLRPTGFSRTTVERCFVKLLHRSVALCGVDGTRRRADGSPIERIGATYVLTAHPDWRIRELIATESENVGPWHSA